MITRALRRAIVRAVAAAGFDRAADPGLRPTGTAGQYAASVALALGPDPRETAGALAVTLGQEPWVRLAEVTGPGYLTITVTSGAFTAVADDVIRAGPACVTSDALAGVAVPAAPPGDPLAAATWEEARAALAVRLTARLATAAGATVTAPPATERVPASRLPGSGTGTGETTSRSADPAGAVLPWSATDAGFGEPGPDLATARAGKPGRSSPREAPCGGYGGSSPQEAAAFAGRDAVLFSLARAIPGRPLRIDPEIIARHVPGNPAYAVRYAHARAASGVRWAVISRGGDPPYPPLSRRADPMAKAAIVTGPSAGTMAPGDLGTPAREATDPPGSPADPGELALLDALSWLPERVAAAARRGRPDEFARYLEDLARVTVDVLSSVSHPEKGTAPGSDKIALAAAARTALAAGLSLLEVSAPDRLLHQ